MQGGGVLIIHPYAAWQVLLQGPRCGPAALDLGS